MERIDLQQLAEEIRHMKRHQPFYRLLKAELEQLGYWKNRQRGDPAKGYKERGKNA